MDNSKINKQTNKQTIYPHTENRKVTCAVLQVWHISSHIRKTVDIVSLLRKKKIILSIIKIKNLKVEIKVSYLIQIHSNPIYLLVCCECSLHFQWRQRKIYEWYSLSQANTVHYYKTPLINILNNNWLMTCIFYLAETLELNHCWNKYVII